MDYKDYYQTLGVERSATQDEIRQSYRKLARKYHPDVSKEEDAEQKFKEIGEAYEVLKDPEKRAAYDKFGSNWQAGQDFKPPPDWDAGFEFRGAGYTGADESQFSDFFESLFGRGGRTHGAQQGYNVRMQGDDQHAKVVIQLRDSYNGSRQTLSLSRPVVDAHGHVRTEPHTLHVNIPKGIIEGQRIRLEGQGMPGFGDGPNGDLYLEITFAKDPMFHAEKRDIHMTLPVTPWEAALGAKVNVPTLGGTVELKIPPGSQGGRKLRLKGRGLSSKKAAGDQIVHLRIVVPQPVNDEQKKLYEEMARVLPGNPRAEMGV